MVSAERSRTARLRAPRRLRPSPRSLLLVVLLACVAVGGLFGSSSAWAQDPQGPADPAAVRDQVREVMSGDAYDYSPSWFERAMEWIAEQLSKLFGQQESGAGGGTFAGGIGVLVGWLVMLAAIGAVVAVIVWVVVNRTRTPRAAPAERVSAAEVEHRRRADEWMADAERLEAAGEWKEALRARYRNLVRVLVDRRQLPDVPGRTTGELRSDLGRGTPGAGDAFDTCCLLFELAWYAAVPTGPEENARFRAEATRVLAVPVAERFDPTLLADDGGRDDRGPVAGPGADAGGPGPADDELVVVGEEP